MHHCVPYTCIHFLAPRLYNAPFALHKMSCVCSSVHLCQKIIYCCIQLRSAENLCCKTLVDNHHTAQQSGDIFFYGPLC